MLKTIFSSLSLCLSVSFVLCLSTARANAPAASPQASTDLICHTQHASECYPAIFQPTEHFKIIHDDQSIPPGLHVRMNLATGLKEARLNLPEPIDAPKADLVIIDNTLDRSSPEGVEEVEAEPFVPKGIQDQSSPDRGYDYRPASFDPEESSLFTSAISELHSSLPPTLETLSTLTDLAHSYDWGLNLAQDSFTVQKLISTLNPPSISMPVEIRSATALLLGTAIQNNPEALAALLSHTNNSDFDPTRAPIQAVLSSLTSPIEENKTILYLQFYQRAIFLLHQLASCPSQLRTFISQNGLSVLRIMFSFPSTRLREVRDLFDAPKISPGEDGHDKVRQRIANFMLDHIFPALASEQGRELAVEILSLSEHEGVSHTAEGKELLQVLEQWNEAFGVALGQYADFLSGKDEREVPLVYKAYSSIREAMLMLKSLLSKD